MANLNFNADEIMQDVLRQAKADIKQRLKKKLDAIVRTTSENPTIRFVDTSEGFTVKIDNCSEELAVRLEEAIAEGAE